MQRFKPVLFYSFSEHHLQETSLGVVSCSH